MCFSHFQVQKADSDSEERKESEKKNAEHSNVSLTMNCRFIYLFIFIVTKYAIKFEWLVTNIYFFLSILIVSRNKFKYSINIALHFFPGKGSPIFWYPEKVS